MFPDTVELYPVAPLTNSAYPTLLRQSFPNLIVGHLNPETKQQQQQQLQQHQGSISLTCLLEAFIHPDPKSLFYAFGICALQSCS